MRTIKLLILLTVMATVFTVRCSKDDDTTPAGDVQKFEVKSVQVPKAMAESNDPGAKMATGYINMINGLSGYSAFLSPSGNNTPGNSDNDERIFTWKVNDKTGVYTVKLVIKETNGEIVWDMYITGTMEGNVLNNFHYIHALKQKDNSWNVLTVWELETGNKYMELSWSITDSETVIKFEVFNETYLTLIVNSDGSGSIELKEWLIGKYVTTYKASWATSGHGEYWEYDNSILTNNGSW